MKFKKSNKMLRRNYIYWLLFSLTLIFIVSCFGRKVPEFSTNSECFLTDLSVTIGQSVDSLYLDSSIFQDYVDEPTEGYSRCIHLGEIFESKILALYNWGYNIQVISISRELIKMRNPEKIDIEESLNHIKRIWHNCNIPVDTISAQLAAIMESIEKDSINSNEFYSLIDIKPKNVNFGLEEVYSWRYTKKPYSNQKSLYIDYHAKYIRYSKE